MDSFHVQNADGSIEIKPVEDAIVDDSNDLRLWGRAMAAEVSKPIWDWMIAEQKRGTPVDEIINLANEFSAQIIASFLQGEIQAGKEGQLFDALGERYRFVLGKHYDLMSREKP